ncbi:MAG: hypothetical protein ABW173_06980 [Sphingomonas sp.]
MTIAPTYHDATAAIVRLSGGSDTLVHVHVGLAIYFGVQMLLNTRRGSLHALQAVFAAEVANELLDRLWCGSWRWPDTLGDVAATMLWPTIAFTVSKLRRRRWEASHARRTRIHATAAKLFGDTGLVATRG